MIREENRTQPWSPVTLHGFDLLQLFPLTFLLENPLLLSPLLGQHDLPVQLFVFLPLVRDDPRTLLDEQTEDRLFILLGLSVHFSFSKQETKSKRIVTHLLPFEVNFRETLRYADWRRIQQFLLQLLFLKKKEVKN